MTPLRRIHNLYYLCRLVYGPDFQLTLERPTPTEFELGWSTGPGNDHRVIACEHPHEPSFRDMLVYVIREALKHAETLDWSPRCAKVEADAELDHHYRALVRV